MPGPNMTIATFSCVTGCRTEQLRTEMMLHGRYCHRNYRDLIAVLEIKTCPADWFYAWAKASRILIARAMSQHQTFQHMLWHQWRPPEGLVT